MSSDTMLQADSLSKSYANAKVLTGVSFTVQPGECVALLGRSGSGKSTLLNLLAGIDRPDSGSVRIKAQMVSDWRERERTLFRRRHIGFVYQFFNLIPTLTVEENIRLPLELNQSSEDRMQSRVSSLLADLGLQDRAQAFPDTLSGGEQQRVALARALAHEPALVLADEPTGNLDAGTGRQVLDLLLRMTRDAGHTLLVVTHSQEVARAADRQLLLADGRLADGGADLAW